MSQQATEDLDALMGRLAEGDRSAFRGVYEHLRGPIGRLCQHLLGHEADARDACQEAMQKIFERTAVDYDRKRPALPWAIAIAGWECRTLKKKRTRRRETTDEGERASLDEGAETAVVQKDLMEAALRTLGGLSEMDRETLQWTFWEEAAPTSGATFRKRRERALERLRTAFRRLYGLD